MPDQNLKLDLEMAIGRLGDPEIFYEIAHYFANRLPEATTQLEEALMENKAEDAMRFAHSLKSNCATVGAEELKEICLKIEKACRNNDLEKAKYLFQTLVPSLPILKDTLLTLEQKQE